jgi:hypothetical protein
VKEQTYRVEYNSNNSGGGWWLQDKDWQKLEAAGWTVDWLGLSFCHSKPFGSSGRPAPDTCSSSKVCPGHRGADSYEDALAAGDEARWLGSIARSASIEVVAYSGELAEGVASAWWADTLGMNPDEEGCNCCGRPHSFWARESKAVPA